jgi:hypothetical protein
LQLYCATSLLDNKKFIVKSNNTLFLYKVTLFFLKRVVYRPGSDLYLLD